MIFMKLKAFAFVSTAPAESQKDFYSSTTASRTLTELATLSLLATEILVKWEDTLAIASQLIIRVSIEARFIELKLRHGHHPPYRGIVS